MYKILLLTDIHFGMKKFSHAKYEEMVGYIKTYLFPYILENDIRDVIHCGDIIDNEMEIDNKLLLDIKKDFINWFEEKKINLYLLHGNHDSYYKNNTDYSFTKVLSNKMLYVKSITEIETRHISNCRITFIPHSKSFSDIKDVGDVIIGHHDVVDVTFNIHQKSKKGMSVGDLDKLKVPILMGHYHNQSITGNCRYLGTLFQHTWGEYGFKKGFWVLDSVQKITQFNINEQLSFIEQNVLPKHIRIEYIQDGKKQPFFIINDGIEEEMVTKDYNIVRDLVGSNIIELKADNYSNENKYMEMLNDLNSVAYTEIVVINSKRLNKAIEQMLEMNEEDGDDNNDVSVIDLCDRFFGLLPETLENKEEMKKLFQEKVVYLK